MEQPKENQTQGRPLKVRPQKAPRMNSKNGSLDKRSSLNNNGLNNSIKGFKMPSTSTTPQVLKQLPQTQQQLKLQQQGSEKKIPPKLGVMQRKGSQTQVGKQNEEQADPERFKVGETLLQRRRVNSITNKNDKLGNVTVVKTQGFKKPNSEAAKQYEKDFNEVLDSLRSFQVDQKLAEILDEEVKELCNRINVLIFDWKQQPEIVQKMCSRESLLQGLILILKDITNSRIRVRAIKQAINIFRSIGFNYILSKTQQKDSILPPEACYELLFTMLKQALKFTETKEVDQVIIEENMTSGYLDLLQGIKASMSPKQFDKKALDLLYVIYSIMKHETANEQIRKQYFVPKNLLIAVGFLHYFDFKEKEVEEEISDKIFDVYISITGLIRNLAIDINCTVAYSKLNVIEKLTKSIELYPDINDLMLNTVRILSKVSLSRDCSVQMCQNTHFIKNILKFYETYKENLFIVIRISFILANLTGFIEDIRKFIYFSDNGFQQIYGCFDHYAKLELNSQPNDEMDKMNITKTGWDFKQMQKENNMEALIKLIRLVANLLTIEEIGQDMVQNYYTIFKDLIKRLKTLSQGKDLTEQHELLQCTLSCLANITFYEKQQIATQDFEYKNAKLELVVVLGSYVMQTENEDLCCEALRVISNLSRQKELAKTIVKFKLIDGIIILLDSNSKDIVYYSLGVLINILKNDEVKNLYGQTVIESILQLVQECTIEDSDMIQLAYKCLGNLMDQNTQLDSKYIKQIEGLLDQTGQQCDDLIEQSVDLERTGEIPEIFDLRNIINTLHNIMPEEAVCCPAPNCGRKFKTKEQLQDHIKRRHNL